MKPVFPVFFLILTCCGKTGSRNAVSEYKSPEQEKEMLDMFVSQLALSGVDPENSATGIGESAEIVLNLPGADQAAGNTEYELKLLNRMTDEIHKTSISHRGGSKLVLVPEGSLQAGHEYSVIVRRANGIHPQVRSVLSGFLVDIPFERTGIAVSERFFCILEAHDQVYCYGPGASESQGRLQRVTGLEHVISLAASSEGACGLTDKGEVFCWDFTEFRAERKSELEEIRKIVAYRTGFCALSRAGSVWCFGKGVQGENGFKVVEGQTGPALVTGLQSGVYDISSGPAHGCAARSFGPKLTCWGSNKTGSFFSDESVKYALPVSTGKPEEGEVRPGRIFTGLNHTCYSGKNQAISCFGRNIHGQLGSEDLAAKDGLLKSGDISLVSIKSAGSHNCGTDKEGKLYCWGWNLFGQLGTGDTRSETAPVRVGVTGTVAEFGVGSYMTVVKTGDNKYYHWGGIVPESLPLSEMNISTTPEEFPFTRLKESLKGTD